MTRGGEVLPQKQEHYLPLCGLVLFSLPACVQRRRDIVGMPDRICQCRATARYSVPAGRLRRQKHSVEQYRLRCRDALAVLAVSLQCCVNERSVSLLSSLIRIFVMRIE